MFKDFLRCKSIAGPVVIMIAALFVVGCSKKIAPVGGSAGLSDNGSASTPSKTPSESTASKGTSPGNRGDSTSSTGSVTDSEMAKKSTSADGSPKERPMKDGSDQMAATRHDSASKSPQHDSQGHKGSGNGMASGGPSFMENVYFDYDKAQVRFDAKKALEENSRWLALNSDIRIQIEGHGDERGTNDYNLALGERRARSIMRYLINLGINESRFSFISYGEEKNICSEKDESCYQKNRRVHFLVKR